MNKGVGTRSIKKNYIYNSLLVGLRMLFPLITYPYVLRVLGPENVGKVNLAISFAMYFSIFAGLGVPQYGTRECARARDDSEELSRVFSELFWINIMAMAVTLAAYFSCFFLVEKMQQEALLYLIVGGIVVMNPFSVEWLYAGLEDYRYISLRSIVFKVVSVAALFLLVLKPEHYLIYAGITVFATVGSHLVNMIHSRAYVRLRIRGLSFKKHMKPVLALFFAAFVASIYTRFDLVLLGFLSGDKNVAFYNVDKKLALLATSIVISLSTVLVPRLAYYFKKGMHEDFRRLAEKSINFIYFLGFPIVTGVIILAPEILHVFGGADFVEGALSLRFIAPVIILESMNAFLSLQILLPTGREGRITIASAAAAAVNLGLNVLFIPLYQHNGITAVLVMTHLMLFVFQYLMARGLIRFSLFKRESLHYLTGSLFIFIVCSGVKALGYGPYRTFVLSVSGSFLIYGLYMILVKDPYINISFGMLKNGWSKITGTGRQWEELE